MLLFDLESHGLFKNKMYTSQYNEQLVCFGLEKLLYIYNDEYFVKNRFYYFFSGGYEEFSKLYPFLRTQKIMFMPKVRLFYSPLYDM